MSRSVSKTMFKYVNTRTLSAGTIKLDTRISNKKILLLWFVVVVVCGCFL